MTIRTVFAVAVAAGLTTFAQMDAVQAEGRDSSASAQVDPSTTGSIGKQPVTPAVAKANAPKNAESPHRPALKAVERSTQKKFSSLPGVKPISLDEGTKSETVVAKVEASAGRKYSTIVSRYASAYGVPVSLAHAVISVESNYRADARGSAGEVGLMQIKPATARMMGYTGSTSGLFDPDTNIKFGMKYRSRRWPCGADGSRSRPGLACRPELLGGRKRHQFAFGRD